MKRKLKIATKVTLVTLVVLALLPVLLPAALLASVVSLVLWKVALGHKTNNVFSMATGHRVYEVKGVASAMVGYALKIGGLGLIDMSISPAIAVPSKGYMIVRVEMCEKLSHLTQLFIGAHEAGHLLDPTAKKFGAGLKQTGEFTADAHAVNSLRLNEVQIYEIFDELQDLVTASMKSGKMRESTHRTLWKRRDRALEIARSLTAE